MPKNDREINVFKNYVLRKTKSGQFCFLIICPECQSANSGFEVCSKKSGEIVYVFRCFDCKYSVSQ